VRSKSNNLAFLLGGISIVGQIILLREMVTVFYGNEIAYAIILASWLVWVSIGSFSISCFSKYIRNPDLWITAYQWIICFVLPASIFVVRSFKQVMDVNPGEIVGIASMCISSLILLAPLTFFIGGLYSLICKFSSEQDRQRNDKKAIGEIYMWEATGAAVGGIVFSFVLVHMMSAMHIAVLMGVCID